YPDGVMLFIGTMFTPLDDRGAPGSGFTHKVGDVVKISAPELGMLVNEVVHCDEAEPWTFGTGALMANLARRGVLRGAARDDRSPTESCDVSTHHARSRA